MRVQYTLRESTVAAIRLRAESLDIQPSRLVEEYLTAALRLNASVTLTPHPVDKHIAVTTHNGSKMTSPAEEDRRAADEAFLAEVFEPDPPPAKPMGEMTDEELDALDDATDAAVPINR